jgi:hypothetical protein
MAEEDEPDGVNPLVIVVASCLVVLALLVGVIALVGSGSNEPPRDRPGEAIETARGWLQAWANDDRKVMHQMSVGKAPTLDAVLDDFRSALQPGAIDAEAAPTALVDGDRATVAFFADVELPGFGTWSYRGSLALVDGEVRIPDSDDTEKKWQVAFSPATVHPALVDGHSLRLSRMWSPRGTLLMTDGSPLPKVMPWRSIAGTVGPATADGARAFGEYYRPGDVVGQSGLQAGFEHELAGTPAGEVQVVAGDQVVEILQAFSGTPGTDVRTTFDPHLVAAALDVLGNEGNGAAMVVIQPSTGAIRAIANRTSTGYNRGFAGRYPTGSTMKVITSVALLEHGITPETRISCPKEIKVNGRVIRNAEEEELGDISFREAFIHSCNTAFIQLAQQLQPNDLVDAAKRFGFDTDLGLGTQAGISQIPPPNGIVDQVSEAIGQGRVLATPLQMAVVAADVAAGGYRKPHLVELPVLPPLEPMSPGVAATLQDFMRAVVSEGTGKKARLPGTPVAGKTGTAEFGTQVPLRTHAWFIAFRGDLALAVIVEDGGFGGDAAAPLAAEFFRRAGG